MGYRRRSTNKSRLIKTAVAVLIAGFSSLASSSRAADQDMNSINQRMDEVQRLFETGESKQALVLLEQVHKDYPQNASAALNLAQYYSQRQEYREAIPFYEQAIQRLARDPLTTPDLVGQLHYNVMNAYNELGQQHHFTKELYLRIFYHLDQAWPAMMAQPHAKEEEQPVVAFARKKIDDYELMNKLGNARVTETADIRTAVSAGAQAAREHAPELSLKSDGVTEMDKLNALQSLQARIRDYPGR